MAKTLGNPNASRWEDLTWDVIEDWCGSRSLELGKSYFRGGHVSKLALAADGALLATVQGTERYVTAVSLTGAGEPDGQCTCPIGGCCKHAVAVVLTYLDAIEKNKPVPAASEDDPRWDKLAGSADNDWSDAEDDDLDDELDEPPPQAVSRSPVRKSRTRRPTAADRKEKAREMLAGWSTDRLVDYIMTVASDHPEVRENLEEQAALQTDDMRELIRQTRKEIRRRTSEEAWVNHWNDEGNLPSYEGVRNRLERLFEAGEFDVLLDLGQELFDLGQEQIGQSHDEGETATEIESCLAVVARAVPKSTRPREEQILYCIRLFESDDYSMSEPFADVLDQQFPKAAWSKVADTLLADARAPADAADAFTASYQRGRHNRWIVEALEKAGRDAEVLPFLEAEVSQTRDYGELVARFLQMGRPDEARRWAMEGIAATKAQWPGIAEQLHSHLRSLAEEEKNWPLVAAYDARPYFEHPSQGSLENLLASARKAKCEETVRAAAMHFAETGRMPNGKKGSPPWPLPEISEPPPKPGTERDALQFQRVERPPGPHYGFLIDLAIHEKRPADVLRWYDAWVQADKGKFGVAYGYADRVADAVRKDFPERALGIYRRGADGHLQHTGDGAYRDSIKYLRKICDVLNDLGRADEWKTYETQLREQYKRRRNFIEMLDRMNSGKIVKN